jgi:hypothetical protein
MTAGPQGPQGEQGLQGEPGAANMTAGPQGPQGEQGLQGEPGEVNYTLVNSTFATISNLSLKEDLVNHTSFYANKSYVDSNLTLTNNSMKNYVNNKFAFSGNWTPTLGWVGTTPTGITSLCSYWSIGNMIFYSIYVQASDSNGAYLNTVDLPAATSNINTYYMGEGSVFYGTGYGSRAWLGNYASIGGYIGVSTTNAGTDNQPIMYIMSGWYPV